MKISHWPLPLSVNGAGGFPNRVVINSRRVKALKLQGDLQRVLNNEIVHVLQQTDCSLIKGEWTWVGYDIWVREYLRLLIRGRIKHGSFKAAYLNHPMEIDSRHWDDDPGSRPYRYWETL